MMMQWKPRSWITLDAIAYIVVLVGVLIAAGIWNVLGL